MKKITLGTLLLCLSVMGWAEVKITIDGQPIECKNGANIEKGHIHCDVVPSKASIKEKETTSICDQTQTMKAHANGGGMVSETADVDKQAWVGKDAVVCDQSIIGRVARLEGATRVLGSAKVHGSSTLVNTVVSGSTEVITSKINDSTISGSSTVRVATIENSKISGATKLTQVKVMDSQISGASEVKNSRIQNSKVSGSTFIYAKSVLEDVTISGAVRIQHSKLNQCHYTGAAVLKNKTCNNDQIKK